MERYNKHHVGKIDTKVNDFLVLIITKLSYSETIWRNRR